MDIAKIRKKAKEREDEKRQEERPLTGASAGEAPSGSLTGAEEQGELPEQPAPEETPQQDAGQKEEPKLRVPAEQVSESGEDDQIELLTFHLASEECAFKVTEVEEILRPQNVTRVPTMPGYMTGITSLRGKIIPVIDLKARLNLKRTETEETKQEEQPTDKKAGGKILIIDGPKGLIGAAVDSVVGVVRVVKDEVLVPPAHLTEAEMKFIEGVVILDKRFISIVCSADTMNIEIG